MNIRFLFVRCKLRFYNTRLYRKRSYDILRLHRVDISNGISSTLGNIISLQVIRRVYCFFQGLSSKDSSFVIRIRQYRSASVLHEAGNI